MNEMILVIPNLLIQNANALSSPYTIGFPAMTAWLGFSHALQRKLTKKGFDDFMVYKTAVISHEANLQVYRGNADFVNSVISKAYPLDKDGKRSAFIEEARINLKISLVLKCTRISKKHEEDFLKHLNHLLRIMKLASGDILDFDKPKFYRNFHEESIKRELKRKLMPGFALVQRKDLMEEAMANSKDALDALLHYLAIHNKYANDDKKWISEKKELGWIVPIAVGFQGISNLSKAKNQRDLDTPHRFAQSVITLGEFKMVYKIDSFDEILWEYEFDQKNDLYICKNN